MKEKGLFIAIEGIDGSGKSSLSKNLAALFSKERPTILTREPGGSEVGAKIRSMLYEVVQQTEKKAQYLLFAADRAQHVSSVICPALEKGYVVISDRFCDSSIAYQGYGNQLSVPMIVQINQWATEALIPDLTIFLRVSVDEALLRIQKGRGHLSYYEQKEFLDRVSFGFTEMYKSRSDVIIIDAHQDENTVLQEAYARVKQWINKQ
jgi:dTMP kinase